MDCKQAQINLYEYSRNLLNKGEAEAVRAHLETCANCRAVLADEIMLAGKLSALPKAAPRADVWPAVQFKISRERHPAGVLSSLFRSTTRKLALASATAAVMAGALFGAISWRASAEATEKERVKEAIAIMQVQPSPEEPTGSTTDAMLQVLKEQVPKNELQ